MYVGGGVVCRSGMGVVLDGLYEGVGREGARKDGSHRRWGVNRSQGV